MTDAPETSGDYPEWAVESAEGLLRSMPYQARNYRGALIRSLLAAEDRGLQQQRALLSGIEQSLQAAIFEYEDRDIYPGARKIMEEQVEGLRLIGSPQ